MYFKSATEAAEFAKQEAESKGYRVDWSSWFTQIACGGRYGRLRPAVGEYHSFTVDLIKGNKESDKCLSITLYGMNSGEYELVSYIN